jgi:hypothetical protein
VEDSSKRESGWEWHTVSHSQLKPLESINLLMPYKTHSEGSGVLVLCLLALSS